MIRIYLSIDNGAEIMEIPVIPPSFKVEKPQGEEIFETVTGEELTFLESPKLKSISWESFFPSKDYPYLRCSREADVWQYGYRLDTWILQKYPIRLIISGTPINMAVKISEFSYEIDTSGDIKYEITLTEFPLVDTETEELSMAQYDELKAMIDSLTARLDAIDSATIQTIEDAPIYYKETLQMLIDKGYLMGDDNSLELTENMARVLTMVNRAGGFHTGMIYNYNDSNIPETYRDALNWFIDNGYILADDKGCLGLTGDMLKLMRAVYMINN